MNDDLESLLHRVGWTSLWFIVFVTLVCLLTSCATAEAISETPVETWVNLERILMALLEDLAALISFLI